MARVRRLYRYFPYTYTIRAIHIIIIIKLRTHASREAAVGIFIGTLDQFSTGHYQRVYTYTTGIYTRYNNYCVGQLTARARAAYIITDTHRMTTIHQSIKS